MSDFQSNGYIKIMRRAHELLMNDADSYLLMSLIMFRSKWTDSPFANKELLPNQCYIGDYKSIGLTEQRYRNAKRRIEHKYFIATFKGTNKGTIATIVSLEFCDINYKKKNEQENEQEEKQGENEKEKTSSLPKTNVQNNEQENEQSTEEKCIENNEQNNGAENEQKTSKERLINKERKKEGNNKYIAQTPSSFRKKDPEDIYFSFDEKKFLNITQEDVLAWKEIYQSVDISKELKLMAQWCLANPTKSKSKKLWRQFIIGWLGRSNEKEVNRIAYRDSREASKKDVVNHDKRVNPKFISIEGDS